MGCVMVELVYHALCITVKHYYVLCIMVKIGVIKENHYVLCIVVKFIKRASFSVALMILGSLV